MLDLNNFLLFLGLSWILIITPGPDLVYVLTRGISGGKKAGVISGAGVTLGILIHTVFAALGLSVILETSALAFTIVKFAGAGYLIYLGIRSFMRSEELNIQKEKQMNTRQIFIQGLLSNTLNPKVALFFVAFLPQFVNPASSTSITVQLVVLGVIFAICTLLFVSVFGYFSGSIGSYLVKRKNLTKWINYLCGTILIFLGLRLAALRK
jgi:threonine/homoserine/homoserine lactone efflux protein